MQAVGLGAGMVRIHGSRRILALELGFALALPSRIALEPKAGFALAFSLALGLALAGVVHAVVLGVGHVEALLPLALHGAVTDEVVSSTGKPFATRRCALGAHCSEAAVTTQGLSGLLSVRPRSLGFQCQGFRHLGLLSLLVLLIVDGLAVVRCGLVAVVRFSVPPWVLVTVLVVVAVHVALAPVIILRVPVVVVVVVVRLHVVRVHVVGLGVLGAVVLLSKKLFVPESL